MTAKAFEASQRSEEICLGDCGGVISASLEQKTYTESEGYTCTMDQGVLLPSMLYEIHLHMCFLATLKPGVFHDLPCIGVLGVAGRHEEESLDLGRPCNPAR